MAMQTISRSPDGCQYNIEVLSEGVLCIDPPSAPGDWDKLPKSAKWSKGAFASPPEIGTRVRAKINELGTGTVQGYFIEHGWVGVHVLPDCRPAWHVRQNGEKNYYLLFGIEVEPE